MLGIGSILYLKMGKKVRIPSRVVDVTEMGRLGGIATAAARTPEERSEAARKAVQARWKKAKAKKATR